MLVCVLVCARVCSSSFVLAFRFVKVRWLRLVKVGSGYPYDFLTTQGGGNGLLRSRVESWVTTEGRGNGVHE